MIRDLEYPQDARREVAALYKGLAYDATVAVAGVALSKVPSQGGVPDFSVPIRCGGVEEDQAVRRDAPRLLSRFSLISMVSRFEVHTRHLLLQRRVIEHLQQSGKKMDSASFWTLLTQVQSESRFGPVRMCDGLVVTKPSAALKERMEWLGGLYRVRNCLAHRLGRVEIIDVKPPGSPLRQTRDEDRLSAVWLRIRISVNEREVTLPFVGTNTGQGKIDFERQVKIWKIGDQIDIDPLDCQSIALSLSFLGQQLEMDFEREMNALLGR